MELEYKHVCEILDYEQETGDLRWKKRVQSQVPAGSIAGITTREGYISIKIQGRKQQAHRLAWLLFHGEPPNGYVDHINAIKSDNRIANLRVVTNTENQHSVFRPQKNSTTGVRGVSQCKNGFLARIQANGKVSHLGQFPTLAEAQAAYLAAKEILHPASTVAKPYLVNLTTQEADK